MSPHQTRSGASVVKSRSTTSGAAGRSPGRVSPRRLRTFRAIRPDSDMIFAMVFTETRQPCLISWIQIFGEP
ncbi:hypothetical protein [Streptomyces sp. MBT53]|uniref:hypothetical protein n=1 Tax=Streptomyces sp. MBT53 TaxID=1488384 RepID=UPI001F3E15E6|nr:hypothetical protein [Streptomyces sp. MBT53]